MQTELNAAVDLPLHHKASNMLIKTAISKNLTHNTQTYNTSKYKVPIPIHKHHHTAAHSIQHERKKVGNKTAQIQHVDIQHN